MNQPPDLAEVEVEYGEGVPPRHGFQGNRGALPLRMAAPRGLSIALSREAGARGGTIARLVGRQLGWQVYGQELLEYMAQDVAARQALFDDLPPACVKWIEARQAELGPVDDPRTANLIRVMLELAAAGEVILIGRGAGCVLPRQTTLNVRIVAPLPDRVAYMGQWLRLPTDEAARAVGARDERRTEYMHSVFGRSPAEPHLYDLVLNSGTLGEETCAVLIAQAARARWEHLSETV